MVAWPANAIMCISPSLASRPLRTTLFAVCAHSRYRPLDGLSSLPITSHVVNARESHENISCRGPSFFHTRGDAIRNQRVGNIDSRADGWIPPQCYTTYQCFSWSMKQYVDSSIASSISKILRAKPRSPRMMRTKPSVRRDVKTSLISCLS